MRTSKRLLALVATVLMLASLFALPYGAAAEDATPTPDGSCYTVGWVQTQGVEQSWTNTHTFGRVNFTPASPITLDSWNYLLAIDVKLSQSFGFSSTDWMGKVQNGGLWVKDANGNETSLSGSPIPSFLPSGNRVENEWVTMYVPLAGMSGTDYGVTEVGFLTFNDTSQYSEGEITGNNDTGVTLSLRNTRVIDVSRDAQGNNSLDLVKFSVPDAEIATVFPDGEHHPGVVPRLAPLYNHITADMDVSKMNVELDLMYVGDVNSLLLQNSESFLFNGNNDQRASGWGWADRKVPQTDTWYHIVTPVSRYGATIEDMVSLSGFRGEAWNDDRNQTFVSKVKNVRITYSDVSALEAALEDAKNCVYDDDAAAAVYEAKLDDARALFSGGAVDYDDFSTALSGLQDAIADLSNYEVHVDGVVDTLSQMPEDWRNLDSVSGNDSGIHLYGDLSNYTLEMDIRSKDDRTLSALLGTNNYFIELRNNEGAENVYGWNVNFSTIEGGNTTSAHLVIPLTAVNSNGVQVAPGITINRAQLSNEGAALGYTKETILTYITQARMPGHSDVRAVCDVTGVKIVDHTVAALEAAIADAAAGTLVAGKYTGASTAAYRALQSDAQALLNDPDATLQEKSRMVQQIEAAKAQFVPIVTEYVQFGAPEQEFIYTNDGVNHIQEYTLAKTASMTLPADCSNLVLRVEAYVDREDGIADASWTFVNREMLIRTTYGGNNVELHANLDPVGDTNRMLNNHVCGQWVTLYYPLSSFGIGGKGNAGVAAADLADAIAGMYAAVPRGYNDTHQPITIKFRNVAIVDPANADLMDRLNAAFADVTAGGHDYTTESYAAYRAVYDQWYPVYENVDLTQTEAAITAMNNAKASLVCVDPTVLTFSQWNRGWGSAGGWDFYADWRSADQGMINIANRNYLNFVLRFDVTFAANGDTPLPSTLTVNSMRFALRKWAGGDDPEGKERSFEWGKVLTSLDPNGVNTIEIPFTALPGIPADTDGSIRDIIMTLNFNEVEGNQSIYTMTIANARLIDTTKEQMAAALQIAANETGSYISNAALDTYLAAQADARTILAKADPTYAELESAQNAIDAAKANLSTLDAQVVGNGSVDAVGGYLVATPDTGYTLAGYTVNGVWTDAETSLEVPLPGAVTAYFVASDEAVALFYGKSNQTFDIRVVKSDAVAAALTAALAKAPAIYGYTFTGWDQSEEDIAIAINEGTTVSVSAEYAQDAASSDFTVTLSGDMTASHKGNTVADTTFSAKFDDRVTVTATGDNFSYWKLDNMVVGFDTTYTFYVSGDNTIQAVYGDSSQSADSVRLSIKKDYVVAETDGTGKNNWVIVAQHYLPAGTTVQEYGVIFAPGSVDLLTGFNNGTLREGKDYLVVRSSSTTANRQYMVTLRHIKPGVTRQAVAYLIDGSGALHFSDNLVSKKIKDPNAPISTMLVLGDSIAAGYLDENPGAYGDNETYRYSTLIQNDTGITVTNRAVSGWATEQLRNGLDEKIADIADVDLISISIGGNDITGGYNSQTETNIRNVLDRLVAKYPDAKIVLHTTYNPYTDAIYRAVADVVINQLNTAVRGIANDYDQVTVLDLYTAFQGKQTTHICSDQTHPNIAGHRLIADLYEDLIPTLR